MTNFRENNKRIAKNTLLLYVRMLATMAISLYTSRIVLVTLGIEDFGIYNVVAGVVSVFLFLNNSMSISVQRYLSFDMGKCGNSSTSRLQQIFNIALIVHVIIALLVLVLSETIGLWFVETHLNIPANRMYAVRWVYQFSILTCLIAIIQVPYNAVIISNERMAIYAYLSILEVVLRLVIVYFLCVGDIDKLILYSILTFFVSFVIALSYWIYCKSRFKEVKFRFLWNKTLFAEILSFACWSSLGEIAWTCVQQGVNIVLNMFFGPVVNAARAVSVQVQSAVMRFVTNFQMAVNPQIIKRYAANEKDEMKSLLFRSTCFSYYLLLFISMPILIETSALLSLWLGVVPEYTVPFCRLMIIVSLIDTLSNLFSTVAKAYGKIRMYQIIVSSLLMLNLPFSYLLLAWGARPESTLVVYGLISVTLIFVRIYLLNKMIGLSLISFLREVMCDITKVTFLSVVISCLPLLLFSSGIYRMFFSLVFSLSVVSIVVYFIGLHQSERHLLLQCIYKFIHR